MNSNHPVDAIPKGEHPGASLASVMGVLANVDPNIVQTLEVGFTQIALRTLEATLLADPEMRKLALYWDSFVGVADEMIKDRVNKLTGNVPSPEVISYLRNCIESPPSRRGGKETIDAELQYQALSATIEATPSRHLRCQLCGYHFRREDMGEPRYRMVDNLQGRLSQFHHPGRLADPLKPYRLVSHNKKPTSLTKLTIDHKVPELGFGWTEQDNLLVACQWCNRGKLIYRRSLEPISTLIAAGLSLCPETSSKHQVTQQIAAVAVVLHSGRSCRICQKGVALVELSIRVNPEGIGTRAIWPWSTEVRCYDCMDLD